MDYIIDSLLQPQKKIKEGYHVVSASLKDGSLISGTLSKEDAQSITVRDASDQSIVVSKSDIASQTISPVSLMPPGLTASLRKDELADMVAFLSELGKEGAYKVSSGRIARTFQYLHDQDGDSGLPISCATSHLDTLLLMILCSIGALCIRKWMARFPWTGSLP